MMNNLYPNILYFSKRDNGYDGYGFNEWLNNYHVNYDEKSFPLYKIKHLKKDAPVNAASLKQFIINFPIEFLPSLIIVIDYLSFIGDGESEIRKVLRELIIEYPEIKFVFDEFQNIENEDSFTAERKYTYLHFLGLNESFNLRFNHRKDKEDRELLAKKRKNEENAEICVKLPFLHCFRTKKETENKVIKVSYCYDDLKLLLDGNSNLFDASNLRNTIKAYFFSDKPLCMDVNANYFNMLKSRSEHLALCVEEERSQALYNAYALYINGYRVKVVNSVTELRDSNRPENEAYPHPSLVIRDYDLQFEDKQGHDTEIYKIRGIGEDKDTHKKTCLIGNRDYPNEYWDNLATTTTFFVSQAARSEIQFKDLSSNNICNQYDSEHKGGFVYHPKTESYCIYGIRKPINGIHNFQSIKAIEERAKASTHKIDDVIFTKRLGDSANSGHSASPFIYHIAESLISRARIYNQMGRYLHAALLSREALEVLNGFHKTLMWEAIHLYAVAENALIMSQVGCEDKKLSYNLNIRLDNIKSEVQRIGGTQSKKATKNVLLQIYSDIRSFCRSREHFESADIALKMMVHEQHKFSFITWCLNAGSAIKGFTSTITKKGISNVVPKSVKESVFHLIHFPLAWLLLMLLFTTSIIYNTTDASLLLHNICLVVSRFSIATFIIALMFKPMQIVFGLVTTRGNIMKFFLMLSCFIILFSGIYYLGFFRHAGITHFVDSPQIAYNMFNGDNSDLLSKKPHCVNLIEIGENIIQDPERRKKVEQFDHGLDIGEVRFYKEITYRMVLFNTIEATLEQGATDLFSHAMIDYKDINAEKKQLLRYIILLHILISWIFLGVFISMLYQKFRNE